MRASAIPPPGSSNTAGHDGAADPEPCQVSSRTTCLLALRKAGRPFGRPLHRVRRHRQRKGHLLLRENNSMMMRQLHWQCHVPHQISDSMHRGICTHVCLREMRRTCSFVYASTSSILTPNSLNAMSCAVSQAQAVSNVAPSHDYAWHVSPLHELQRPPGRLPRVKPGG